MVNRLSTIDLSRLPPPNAIDPLDFEALLAARMADFVARAGAVGFNYDVGALETDPIKIDNEVHSYRELLMRARVNDGIRAVLPAYAKGSDLDAICARANIVRAEGEPDSAFLIRYLASFGAPAAGSVDAYYFHAATAWPQVHDIAVLGPGFHGQAGRVEVYLMAADGGEIAPEVMTTVVKALRHTKSNRPLTDMVYVSAAQVQTFQVSLTLSVPMGPDPALVAAQARTAVQVYLATRAFIGVPVYRNAIAGAAYVANVDRVTIDHPVADLIPEGNRAVRCTDITINTEVVG